MSLRFHEISEGRNQIINPLSPEKLTLVGEICDLGPNTRHLDLACGKGEMLSQWSQRWGIQGVGVDLSHVFVDHARARATELGVDERLTFLQGDAAEYRADPAHSFDVVSCLGATWIGGGLVGTLRLMEQAVKPDGLMLVGEPYWITPPPAAALTALNMGADDFTSLIGTLDRIESAGWELVEMVLADGDSWDRYAASQWLAIYDWLQANPDDPIADELRAWNAANRRAYLEYERPYLNWGVFVLRPKQG